MEQFFDIFRFESGWDVLRTIIDMMIVYVIIYRVLLLIKGTRALQAVIGLVLVVAFFYLSGEQWLDLEATHWFIERFIANFIIIVVIIFQQDIRRGLAQMGASSLFWGNVSSFQETHIIEEVIKASVMLSSRKIGALIALEREANLGHYTEEGIKVDAQVTKDLLFSLFLPEHQNPLHDGAVIVQKGRVVAAGCFLPLTNNPRVEKSLGTRHRAGIGLTEDTDAAVVIVSEETGIISVAYEGELFRELDANQMRDLLQRIFRIGGEGSEDPQQESWRERFRSSRRGRARRSGGGGGEEEVR